MATNTITRDIKAAFGIIIKERPYVLRAYFDTQLLLAESKGKITHAYRQFFMGHKGDIEAKYTTNKHRLPEHLIADMKEAYERSQNFLTPFEEDNEVNEKSKKEILLEMWKEQAKLYGIDPMKIKIEKQRTASQVPSTISKTSNDDNEIDAIKTAIQDMIRKNNSSTDIINATTITNPQQQLPSVRKEYESKIAYNEDELLFCVEDGWNIVKELSNGKIILRRNKTRTASGQSD